MASPYSLDTFLTSNNVVLGPDPGYSNKPTFALLKNDFGDGYSGTMGDGINNVRDTWTLTWSNLPHPIADQTETFLRQMGGYTPFMWTPPTSSVARQFKCSDYTRTEPDPAVSTISATLVQDFSL